MVGPGGLAARTSSVGLCRKGYSDYRLTAIAQAKVKEIGVATRGNPSSYAAAATKKITARNGIEYAYREVGTSPVLLLLQHFRGNLDNWDPALIDDLSAKRRVLTFNNTGVGSSSGATPSTIYEMSKDALAFVEALGCAQRVTSTPSWTNIRYEGGHKAETRL